MSGLSGQSKQSSGQSSGPPGARGCTTIDKELIELAEGRLDLAEREAIEAHVSSCSRCAAALGRLRTAREAFRVARGSEPEGIAYEQVGAQIAWRVGRELEARAARRRFRPWLFGAAGGALLGAAVVVVIMLRQPESRGPATAATAAAGVAAPKAAAAPDTPGHPLRALATLIEADAELGLSPEAILTARSPEHLAAAMLGKGTHLRSGEGRLALMLEAETGLVLEPGSDVVLDSLDDRHIEISLLAGKATFEVKTRRPDQRFVVHASGRTVTVRGTRFVVDTRRAALRVGVSHGRVEITAPDTSDVLRVDSGVMAEVGRASDPNGARVGALADDERAELDATLPIARGFGSVEALRDGSGLVQLSSSAAAALSLDGVYLGRHTLLARVPMGRHLVEAAAPGQRTVSRWIELTSKAAKVPVAVRLPIGGPAATTQKPQRARPIEIDQLVAGAAREIRGCYDEGLKRRSDLEGSVLLRFDVDSDGTLAPVEVSSSTIEDPAVERCLQGVVQKWRFPAGDRATVIYPIELSRK